MVKLDDEALNAKGVAALGARRKMLKVFEQIKQHCDKNVSNCKHFGFVQVYSFLFSLNY